MAGKFDLQNDCPLENNEKVQYESRFRTLILPYTVCQKLPCAVPEEGDAVYDYAPRHA